MEGRGHLPLEAATAVPPRSAEVTVSAIDLSTGAATPQTVRVTCPALSKDDLYAPDELAAPMRCGTESQQVRAV